MSQAKTSGLRTVPFANKARFRIRLIAILVVAGGVCVALGVAEGMVRLFFPYSRDTAIPGQLFIIDGVLGWKFRASATSVHRTRHFAVEYVTNAAGFRDKPRLQSPRSGRHRILLYGDSLMFGWGIHQADRFSDLLEKRMDRLEVWNRAVPGYGIDQEMLSYEVDASSEAFDEAMFFVAKGTLERIHSGYIYAKFKPQFTLDGADRLELHPVPHIRNAAVTFAYGIFSPFYLPYFLQNQVGILKANLAARRGRTGPGDEPKYFDAVARQILLRALGTTRQKHHRMSVLVGDIWLDDREHLRQFCEQNSIGFLEVPQEIAETAINDHRMDLVLGRYDFHWNDKANRLLADNLERNIR